jgi:hypothetical protein
MKRQVIKAIDSRFPSTADNPLLEYYATSYTAIWVNTNSVHGFETAGVIDNFRRSRWIIKYCTSFPLSQPGNPERDGFVVTADN